jgi:hypothetical protein
MASDTLSIWRLLSRMMSANCATRASTPQNTCSAHHTLWRKQGSAFEMSASLPLSRCMQCESTCQALPASYYPVPTVPVAVPAGRSAGCNINCCPQTPVNAGEHAKETRAPPGAHSKRAAAVAEGGERPPPGSGAGHGVARAAPAHASGRSSLRGARCARARKRNLRERPMTSIMGFLLALGGGVLLFLH